MGLRETIHRYPVVVLAAAILVLAGSVLYLRRGSSTGSLPSHRYFFDLETKTLFAADRQAQPPLDAPSGPGKGVAAAVYGCGDCGDVQAKIVYLATYDAFAQVAMQKKAADGSLDPALVQVVEKGLLVAKPVASGDAPQWLPAHSPEGKAIVERVRTLCGDKAAEPCFP